MFCLVHEKIVDLFGCLFVSEKPTPHTTRLRVYFKEPAGVRGRAEKGENRPLPPSPCSPLIKSEGVKNLQVDVGKK
jgi:hypothetical protein